ncbi:unnamed protein product [Prorocentrum cordatum]|uniref:Uncharacterized protein n=1 Tax=Prorocentrum cordatum TaxID=2364126 RepID=A0ABN9WMD9_9DINO|nr:unnamed protein product [Polarella glacialis]
MAVRITVEKHAVTYAGGERGRTAGTAAASRKESRDLLATAAGGRCATTAVACVAERNLGPQLRRPLAAARRGDLGGASRLQLGAPLGGWQWPLLRVWLTKCSTIAPLRPAERVLRPPCQGSASPSMDQALWRHWWPKAKMWIGQLRGNGALLHEHGVQRRRANLGLEVLSLRDVGPSSPLLRP